MNLSQLQRKPQITYSPYAFTVQENIATTWHLELLYRHAFLRADEGSGLKAKKTTKRSCCVWLKPNKYIAYTSRDALHKD
jgi:hypothetical protein